VVLEKRFLNNDANQRLMRSKFYGMQAFMKKEWSCFSIDLGCGMLSRVAEQWKLFRGDS